MWSLLGALDAAVAELLDGSWCERTSGALQRLRRALCPLWSPDPCHQGAAGRQGRGTQLTPSYAWFPLLSPSPMTRFKTATKYVVQPTN